MRFSFTTVTRKGLSVMRGTPCEAVTTCVVNYRVCEHSCQLLSSHGARCGSQADPVPGGGSEESRPIARSGSWAAQGVLPSVVVAEGLCYILGLRRKDAGERTETGAMSSGGKGTRLCKTVIAHLRPVHSLYFSIKQCRSLDVKQSQRNVQVPLITPRTPVL